MGGVRTHEANSYIDRCTEIKDEINGWLRLSGEIQSKISTKFEFDNGLISRLRSAMLLTLQ